MKIDNAIKEFLEKYNETAIKSIEEISLDFGLSANKNKINLFNINEGFKNFNEFIDGYVSYKVENINNSEASTNEIIHEQTEGFINNLFKNSQFLYSELPSFISTYLSGVKEISEKVDTWKEIMIEAGVDNESIGSINDFVDLFVDKLHESFNPSMDRILWASGFNAKEKLNKSNNSKELKPVFL
jgi:hypothetical protein